MTIKRHFTRAKNAIHYLQTGAGDTLIMLHPSPLSSTALLPIIKTLSSHANIIAPDTPGYGNSAPLDNDDAGLTPYINSLKSFIDNLELGPVYLYGNATGAQIAIEFAKVYPQQCNGLLLENVSIFTDEEREKYKQYYFPDLSPKVDGSHLEQAWKMVKGLFIAFPWYSKMPEDQLHMPMPSPNTLQSIFIDYLRAGPDYARAYVAALNNEKPENLLTVPVSTNILLWQDSILKKYSDRINELNLPNHIQCINVGSGFEERCKALVKSFKHLQSLR